MHNEPYFTSRLNRLHNLALFTCIVYCACRIIMLSMVQEQIGGQVDTEYRDDENIQIPLQFYEFTRSFIDIEGDGVQTPVILIFLCFVGLLIGASFHFARIMYYHCLYYLVMCEEIDEKMKKDDISDLTKSQVVEFKSRMREAQRDDCCSWARWNHRKCLDFFMCICCRAKQYRKRARTAADDAIEGVEGAEQFAATGVEGA